MGIMCCFGQDSKAEPQEKTNFTPLQPQPPVESTQQPNHVTQPAELSSPRQMSPAADHPAPQERRLQQLLEEAQTEIQRLTSRIKSMESERLGMQEVNSQRDLNRTMSDPEQLNALQKQVLEAQLQKATTKASDLELEVQSLRANLVAAERARDAADQAQQHALSLHLQTQEELKATRLELQAVQQQAASSAAAIDDLYCQTASFLQQQGVATGLPPAGLPPAGTPSPQRPKGSVHRLATTELASPRLSRAVTMDPGIKSPSARTPDGTANLHNSFKGLVDRQQEMQARVDALVKQVEVLQLERTSVQQAYEQAFDQQQAAREEVHQLQVELAEAQAKLGSLPTDAAVQEQADVRHQATAQLEAQLKQLREDNARLASQAEAAQVAATQAAQQAVADRAALVSAQAALTTLQASGAAARSTADEGTMKELEEKLKAAEAAAEAARQEAHELRAELESHSFAAEGTAGQVEMLMRDLATAKKRYTDLEANMRMKDEMMGILQTQLAEVADIDLDGAMAAAVTRPPPLAPTPRTQSTYTTTPR